MSEECHYYDADEATERLHGAPACAECVDWLEAASTDKQEQDDAGADDQEDDGDAVPSTTESRVPSPLDELGQVFIPVEPGEKGTTRPRTDETLYEPDNPVFDAYLENGHNYGIACRGDLAILDEDEPDALEDLVDQLPETPWQISGSRTSRHRFFLVPGLEDDIPLDDPETGENLGHIKAAEQSYVIGPGSLHPSENRYGPLRGPDEFATLDESELRELIEPWTSANASTSGDDREHQHDHDHRGGGCSDHGLDVYDVLPRSSYPEDTRVEHPYHGSSTGANFMVNEGGETFRCWRHGVTGNALHLIGVEQGVINCGEWDGTGLSTDTWSDIFDAAREAGYDLPEREFDGYDPDAVEHTVILPESPQHRATVNGWDWRAAGRDDGLTKDDARQRTVDAITEPYERADDVLIEALPSMGKSFGAILAAALAGEQITIATLRGHEEMYDQYLEWADEHGLTALVLPSVTDCPTYPSDGEPESEWERRFERWYANGATPKGMHVYGADFEGEEPPCEHGEEHCPCLAKWDFDPDDYDVLIGHYNHLHSPSATKGRTVVIDEFPASAFETVLDERLATVVSRFLETRPEIPFDNYSDLLENRDDGVRRGEALLYFEDNGIEREELEAFTEDGHAMAPVATYALLTGEDLGNGYERASLSSGYSGGFAVRNRADDWVSILRPPETLEYARNIVALDGTPTPIMWRYAVGRRLDHRTVLDDDRERREYIREALNLNIVRTTDAAKSYAAGESEIDNRVTVDEDRALLERIVDEHGTNPGEISTKRANRVYDDHDVLDLVDRAEHYGNLKGSNHFGDTQLGVVLGSQNYGPEFVEKWGAYIGEAIEPEYPGEDFDLEAGARTDYGPVGNKIRRHMTEHQTLQAVMRFGRSDTVNGAVVYCHTNTLPDWVPIAGEARVLKTWSDGMKQVIAATRECEEWTTAEIADAVEIGERQVRTHLNRLADRDVVDKEIEGNGYVWRDDGLHRVDENGDVDLEPIDLDDLDDDESAEVARIESYRWDFRSSPDDPAGQALGDEQSTSTTPDQPATADGPPPGPGD